MFVFLAAMACGCGRNARVAEVDALNDKAYRFHYVSLDSTAFYATAALEASEGYPAGRSEALNNLAFVDIAAMDYASAQARLGEALSSTDNRLELFVANVQMMRLCQRTARNKEFYAYYEAAKQDCARCKESLGELSQRQRARLVYAESEMAFVYSAYLFYTGRNDDFRAALRAINADEIARDTAQLLNYLYNIGAGGYFAKGSGEAVAKKEFSALVRCYLIALRSKETFWQANALQAMGEHLADRKIAPAIIAENKVYLRAVNDDLAEDSLLAGNLTQRAVNQFIDYGDVYQTAAALRSLSDCYFAIGLFDDAVYSLNQALARKQLVLQSPALAASIYERLSVSYAALGNKPASDRFRNLYLDAHENARQDRELDLRAEQLDKASSQLNLVLLALLAAVILLCGMLFMLLKRRSRDGGDAAKRFLQPLKKWQQREAEKAAETAKMSDEIAENRRMAELELERNLQTNIEQRTKTDVATSILPFINRLTAELHCLTTRNEPALRREARFAYIAELNDKINEYNDVLTRWIQLRAGALRMKIESFPLQELFDIIAKSKTAFEARGITLKVKPTTAVVKADKALTLFMVNTLADNARKASGEGGTVEVEASKKADFIEVSVADNGAGISEEKLQTLFARQTAGTARRGFGLMNCKGIIESYKKAGRIFDVCQITAESEKGKGSTFRFRLPHGTLRTVFITLFFALATCVNANNDSSLQAAREMADSTYFCNLQGRYFDALHFAQAAFAHLNNYYRAREAGGTDTLQFAGKNGFADLRWATVAGDSAAGTLLDVRNETAVAALALHEWDVYSFNNKAYTALFQELSSDRSLPAYVKNMQQASDAKNVAAALLAILLAAIVAVYYLLYFRRRAIYRTVTQRVTALNGVLLDEALSDDDKIEKIRRLWNIDETAKTSAGNRLLNELNNAARRILATLESGRGSKLRSAGDIELAGDELHRITFEAGRLHVANNVLDNCLSTLKHETMYYPSRIRRLLALPDRDAARLEEAAQYYQELFSLLIRQAQCYAGEPLPLGALKTYLRTLLMTLFEGIHPTTTQREMNSVYEEFELFYPDAKLTAEEASALFTPLTKNWKCLLLRQTVREMGEACGRRGCGVRAAAEEGGVRVTVVLAKNIKFVF
ncbi:MAG: DUF5112 domain-containing protein [Prevotella sp.]|nr:DUF5112 domain-containing protein [Prevotella sp.]